VRPDADAASLSSAVADGVGGYGSLSHRWCHRPDFDHGCADRSDSNRPDWQAIRSLLATRDSGLMMMAGQVPEALPVAAWPVEAVVVPLARPLARTLLGMGVETKSGIALGRGATITLWPTLGDLADPDTRVAFEQAVEALFADPTTRPDGVVVDAHPDMVSTLVGRRLAALHDLPVLVVPHHRAHAAAGMAEQGLTESLALAFDGMGWGEDGRLWGAELLHLHPGGCERLGTFAPAPLPGADAAVREPLRQLVGRLVGAGVELTPAWQARHGLDATTAAVWVRQCRQGINAPLSHAAGRLFDAFAAWLGVAPACITHEGEPAIRLEAVARLCTDPALAPTLPFTRRENGRMLVIDWGETFRLPQPFAVAEAVKAAWAWAFHRAVADAILALVDHGVRLTGLRDVVSSGGVFMNRLLRELLWPPLQQRGVVPWLPRRVPVGDGGIALGQVYAATGMGVGAF
ncbi:MAG: hypothetical protein HQL66_15340, partial [Magnetococcales bacterium]|nr:hypothetical protein [Magnetococcales bacterium]